MLNALIHWLKEWASRWGPPTPPQLIPFQPPVHYLETAPQTNHLGFDIWRHLEESVFLELTLPELKANVRVDDCFVKIDYWYYWLETTADLIQNNERLPEELSLAELDLVPRRITGYLLDRDDKPILLADALKLLHQLLESFCLALSQSRDTMYPYYLRRLALALKYLATTTETLLNVAATTHEQTHQVSNES